MFTQNFIKLSVAVHELLCWQRKTSATMLKTILPSLPWAVTVQSQQVLLIFPILCL